MLDHLRARLRGALTASDSATLSSGGPASVQADVFPCEVVETRLYLLVPRTSDHLFNLESAPDVVITSCQWQVRGVAQVLATPDYPPLLALLRDPEAAWCELVEVRPRRVQLRNSTGWGYRETIDVDVDED